MPRYKIRTGVNVFIVLFGLKLIINIGVSNSIELCV